MNLNNIPRVLRHLEKKYETGGHKHPAFRFTIYPDGSGSIRWFDDDGDLTIWRQWGGRNGSMDDVLFEGILSEL